MRWEKILAAEVNVKPPANLSAPRGYQLLQDRRLITMLKEAARKPPRKGGKVKQAHMPLLHVVFDKGTQESPGAKVIFLLQ